MSSRLFIASCLTLTLSACESSVTPPVRPLPASGVTAINDLFASMPVGEGNGSPCCIYHTASWPVGSTIMQQLMASFGTTYNHANFNTYTGWRNDSLLKTTFINWNYMRSIAPTYGWLGTPSTSPALVTKRTVPGDTTQWPATDLRLNYRITVLQVNPPLSASVSGPTSLTTAGTYQWSANASGSSGIYAYSWDASTNGGGSWSQVCGPSTNNTCSRTVNHLSASFLLRANVSADGGSNTTASTSVSVNIPAPPPPPPAVTIVGQTTIAPNAQCTWGASVSGTVGSVTYQWTVNGSPVGTNSSTLTYGSANPPFEITVTITASNGSAADSHNVSYDANGWCQ